MANDTPEWHYCIEIQSNFKGLAILQEDFAEWMERSRWPAHKMEIEQSAKLVVRFKDYQQAQHFYFSFREARATFTYLDDNKKSEGRDRQG